MHLLLILWYPSVARQTVKEHLLDLCTCSCVMSCTCMTLVCILFQTSAMTFSPSVDHVRSHDTITWSSNGHAFLCCILADEACRTFQFSAVLMKIIELQTAIFQQGIQQCNVNSVWQYHLCCVCTLPNSASFSGSSSGRGALLRSDAGSKAVVRTYKWEVQHRTLCSSTH